MKSFGVGLQRVADQGRCDVARLLCKPSSTSIPIQGMLLGLNTYSASTHAWNHADKRTRPTVRPSGTSRHPMLLT